MSVDMAAPPFTTTSICALDIIDECMAINFKVKKNSLRLKASPIKYVGKYPILHVPRADFLDDEDIATGSIKHSIIKPGTPQSRGKSETCFSHLPPSVALSLSSRPNTPLTGISPGTADTGKIPIVPMGGIKGTSFNKLPVLRKSSSSSFASSRSLSSRSIGHDTMCSNECDSSITTNDSELEARRILRAVENELKHWWHMFPLKRGDKDERGYVAEDLMETHFTNRLESFPRTTGVMSIRQEFLTLLDNFESSGKLSCRDSKHAEVKPTTKYAIEKEKASRREVEEKAWREEEARRVERESEGVRLEMELERARALQEKRERDKGHRREQYQAYMRSLSDQRSRS